jgi:FtsP/CotA-like multicopper oxidase with cupredoxin domain
MGMAAELPSMDPRPMRTMVDMGMAMGSMSGMNMTGMDGMNEKDMAGMGKAPMPKMNERNSPDMAGMAGMDMGTKTGAGTKPLPQPGPGIGPLVKTSAMGMDEARLEPSNPVHLRVGPQVGQVSMHASNRLDEPGDGLNNNGRRVLTYRDLRARYRGVDGRPPSREIELHITGNMERYIWGFNGEKFSNAEPIVLKLGERVRFVLVNDTMMEHPIHLHGLWSELENGHGEFLPYKHTVIVKPSERLSYLVSADTPGHWASIAIFFTIWKLGCLER